MRLQDSPAACGAASVCNALEAIGIETSQEIASKLAGTNGTHGTSERGVIKALDALGARPIKLHESDPGVALLQLRGYLLHGIPVIVLVDASAHWAVAVGTLGPRVLVVDSADGGLLQSLEPEAFMARWKTPGEKKPFYGIAAVRRQ